MILDAHQHFWKYSPSRFGWIDESMDVLKRDYLPSDLKPLLSAAQIEGTILVEACQSLEETQWLLDLASQYDFIKGVVGWLDLQRSDVPRQLEGLTKVEKLVGVRHHLQDEPDDEFMLTPSFRRGIAQLSDMGLTYDLLIYPKHLSIATRLVQEFPNQRFVLNHVGKPEIRAKQIDSWRRGISSLASYPNVFCKLSGLVTEASWDSPGHGDLLPYVDVAFLAFGPDRVMMGSDWPVCNLAASYGRTVGLAREYLPKLPVDAQEGVMGANCSRFYFEGTARHWK